MAAEAVVLKVGGMSCGGCARSVSAIVKKVLGEGGEVEVRLEEGEAALSATPQHELSEEQVARVIEALLVSGFPATAQ